MKKFPPRYRRAAAHAAEAAGLLAVMAIFACIPVDWASALGGRVGRALGPRLAISRRAMPLNSDAENRAIVRGMWDNLGRSMAEYPHLRWICSPRSGRVTIVNREG